MTREDIRQMAEEWKDQLVKSGWGALTIPDPEPAYWDYFPHLRPVVGHKCLGYPWKVFWEGKYESVICAACGQVAWEHDSIWQALVYLGPNRLEYYVGNLQLCLPCHKAIHALPNIVIDPGYEDFFFWDYTDVVPSEGVFTEEFWCTKAGAKLNYSADELVGVLNGTLTHKEIWKQRVERWSQV